MTIISKPVHTYRVDWDVKANNCETHQYCYVKANTQKQVAEFIHKKFVYYRTSVYVPNHHMFHIEIRRDDNAQNIPNGVRTLSAMEV